MVSRYKFLRDFVFVCIVSIIKVLVTFQIIPLTVFAGVTFVTRDTFSIEHNTSCDGFVSPRCDHSREFPYLVPFWSLLLLLVTFVTL